MFNGAAQQTGGFGFARVFTAVLLGLLGSAAIWVITPYNNFILRLGYISDDYLASSVLMMLLLLVLVINPLLRLINRNWALNFKQLALAIGIMFMGATLTSSGGMREIPYPLAQQARDASEWKDVSDRYAKANLPTALFPADQMTYGARVDDARYFLMKLPEGEPLPWDAWAGPAISWGLFYLGWWVMMIGLAGVVLPQWRRNERVPFPLVNILRTMIAEPEDNRLFPPLFRSRGFWIAVISVWTLYLMRGMNMYMPNRVPAVPLSWNLGRLFTEEPLSYLPWYVKTGRIYFIFLGVAYFMSNRVGFSLWFFMVIYAVYTVLGQAYAPPFNVNIPVEHRTGAMFVVTASILWLGRKHWGRVFGSLLRLSEPDAGTDGAAAQSFLPRFLILGTLFSAFLAGGILFLDLEPRTTLIALAVGTGLLLASACRPVRDERTQRDRGFAVMFLLGGLLMIAWLVWAGVQVPWALLLVLVAFVYGILVTRIVAETGVPIVGFYDMHFWHVFSLLPIAWVNHTTAWFTGALSALLGDTTRVAVPVMATQALHLDETATPRHQARLGKLLVLVLLLSFVCCGAVHVALSYEYSTTLDREHERPISAWGASRLWPAGHLLWQKTQGEHGKWDAPPYSRPLHLTIGAGLAAALQWACLAWPKWPLHPVGLLLVYTWFGEQLWISVLVGWLLRAVIIFFGGARLYTRARPVFLGLLMGEVISVLFWGIVSGILALMGKSYYAMQILPY